MLQTIHLRGGFPFHMLQLFGSMCLSLLSTDKSPFSREKEIGFSMMSKAKASWCPSLPHGLFLVFLCFLMPLCFRSLESIL